MSPIVLDPMRTVVTTGKTSNEHGRIYWHLRLTCGHATQRLAERWTSTGWRSIRPNAPTRARCVACGQEQRYGH